MPARPVPRRAMEIGSGVTTTSFRDGLLPTGVVFTVSSFAEKLNVAGESLPCGMKAMASAAPTPRPRYGRTPLVMKLKGEPLLTSSSLSDSLLAGADADSKSTSSEGVCCPAVRNRAFDPGVHAAPLDIRKQLLMLLCGDSCCAATAGAVASATTAPASIARILPFMRHISGEVGTDRVGRSTRHATHIQQQAYRERVETPDYNQLLLSRSKPLFALTNALAQPHVQSQFAACFTSSSISVLVPARLQMAAQH